MYILHFRHCPTCINTATTHIGRTCSWYAHQTLVSKNNFRGLFQWAHLGHMQCQVFRNRWGTFRGTKYSKAGCCRHCVLCNSRTRIILQPWLATGSDSPKAVGLLRRTLWPMRTMEYSRQPPSNKVTLFAPKNCGHIRGGLWREGEVNDFILTAAKNCGHIERVASVESGH